MLKELMVARGDPSRDRKVQDVIVKVILPRRVKTEMPRNDQGQVIATVQGAHRYLSSTQPISKPVFDQCYNGVGGYGYYIADYSSLLKMWILGDRMNNQDW